MRIAFVSNFLSLHQLTLCEELFRTPEVEFRFIASTPISETRMQMGWDDFNDHCFVIKIYSGDDEYQKALKYVAGADVVIIGHNEADVFFRTAVKNENAIIFRCTERLYKRGRWRALSPRGLYYRWDSYYKYPRKNQYLLCSSAYAAKDFALLGAFRGRCFKWGYFPPNEQHDIEKLILQKRDKSIFWAGRLLEWKHPELPIQIAEQLRDEKIPFEMNIAGDGPLFQRLQSMIQHAGLEEEVHLLGNLLPEQVRQYMRDSQIFLATSDYQEGWGAVINEAMSDGCAVVGCEAMGAVPYLIQTGINGYSYGYKKDDVAYSQVKKLFLDEELRCQIMKAAYATIQNEWNGRCAADRLIRLSSALLKSECLSFSSGPCSKAELL